MPSICLILSSHTTFFLYFRCLRTILLAYALLCAPTSLPFSFSPSFPLQIMSWILATAPLGLCARSCSTLYSDALYHEYLLVMTSLVPISFYCRPPLSVSHETCIQKRVPRDYVQGLTHCFSIRGRRMASVGPPGGKVMVGGYACLDMGVLKFLQGLG